MKKNIKTAAKPAAKKDPAMKSPARRKLASKKTAREPAAAKKTRKTPTRRRTKASPAADIENLGELPRGYGQEQIFVIAQEPHLLFCYWDYSLTESIDDQVFLRHARHGASTHDGEVPVPADSNSWYLPVRDANTSYRVELGFYNGGKWKMLTQSATVLTPRDAVADPGYAEFADLNFHSAFQNTIEKLRAQMREGETLAAAIARLRQPETSASEELSQAELSVLEALLGTHFASLSSGELARLMTSPGASLFSAGFAVSPPSSWTAGAASWGLVAGELSSGFLAQFGLAGASWGSAAWSSAMGSWSSGAQASSLGAMSSWAPGASWSAQPFSRPTQRGFFMHVNAELIFYGGTQPDAKVTIDGQEIALRPDGSFHYHFVFPDGAYEIPIVATSPDGQETRRAVLRFERVTAREGDVSATAQPLMQRPMGATA